MIKRFSNIVFCLALLFCLTDATVLQSGAEEIPRKLSLEEALDIALANNPGLAEAESRLAEAEARLRATRGAHMPTLKARGAYEYLTEDQRLFPATYNGEPGVFGSQILGAELALNLPLYAGGRLSARTRAAEWSSKATQQQLARTREKLAYQVTALFNELLAQQEVVRALDTAVQAMEEHQRVVQALVEAQKAARVDLLRTEVRRAELQERQTRERNRQTLQHRALSVLLGWAETAAPEIQGKLTDQPAGVCEATEECVLQALERRTDYSSMQAEMASIQADLRGARAGYLPTLSAQAAYGARWMPSPADQPDGTDEQQDFGRIGLVLELPIFDGNITSARVAEQQARLRGTRERLRAAEFQIRYEVETASADIQSAVERIRTAETAVDQAGESFRIIQKKYDLGKGAMTDVLEAQTAFINAQTTRARALADMAIAVARRKLAMGEILP